MEDLQLALTTSTETHPQEQRIFPGINFACAGSITRWTVLGTPQGQGQQFPWLQIWRHIEDDSYTLVHSTNSSTSIDEVEIGRQLGVYEYTPDTPVDFQQGDILGVFQPAQSQNSLQVAYARDAGARSYYIMTETPAMDTFRLSDPSVRTDVDYPLIAVDIMGVWLCIVI